MGSKSPVGNVPFMAHSVMLTSHVSQGLVKTIDEESINSCYVMSFLFVKYIKNVVKPCFFVFSTRSPLPVLHL